MNQTDKPTTDKPASGRLGLSLFFVYLAFYLVFVLTSAFACNVFEMQVIGGLNLAVVYGFGLIVLAFVLSIVYGYLSRPR